jgi:hypothetical protein
MSPLGRFWTSTGSNVCLLCAEGDSGDGALQPGALVLEKPFSLNALCKMVDGCWLHAETDWGEDRANAIAL